MNSNEVLGSVRDEANLVGGIGVSIFVFVLILKLKTGTHNRGLGPDTCFLGSHMLVKVDLTVG
jgi:hypothetical protein